MKLVNKQIEKDGSGWVELIPEDEEDMWHVYNLISEGDQVRAKTDRKVHSTSNTGTTTSYRVQLALTILVKRTMFSAAASTETTGDQSTHRAVMGITGQVTEANDYVRIGAYHTLELERGRKFRLTKATGKRSGTSSHDKAMASFLSTVYASILRLIPFDTLKVVVIASPGFTKDTLYDYIFQQATETNNKPLLGARSKFLRVHSNTPHVHSLVEALRDPGVAKMLQGAKFAKEGLALDKFHKMLSTDELRAWYGPKHVALAVDRGAVGTLLISDDLFRAADPEKRNRYVQMVDEVRARGGEAVIFSSMHETGIQLNLLTGIAAILTYPLDIEVVEMEEREEAERLEREAAEAASGGTTPAASGSTTPFRSDGI
ncbi:hypothetical protein CcaverHIS631_0204710 [Cutaneotrichosporon cavernicola]|nr:hypothetical protein CcaverHIS631_0204710 [Cutaneotrichosporon cavernicola]